MNPTWVPVNGDDLQLMDKVVAFLQGEFCPSDADPLWSVEYFRWKLGPNNPAGAGYVSLAMLDDKVVGIVSLTKKRLLLNGKPVVGCEVGDTYTSALARRGVQPAVPSTLDPDPASFVNRSIFGRLASDARARAEAPRRDRAGSRCPSPRPPVSSSSLSAPPRAPAPAARREK